jgi:hypothetical protein
LPDKEGAGGAQRRVSAASNDRGSGSITSCIQRSGVIKARCG